MCSTSPEPSGHPCLRLVVASEGERQAPVLCRAAHRGDNVANGGSAGSHRRRTEDQAVKRAVLIALLIPAAASFGDLKQQLAKCEIEAVKVYPRFIDAPAGQPLAFIQLCMKAAGYDWAGDAPNCGPSSIMMGKPDLDDSGARCFAPSKSN